MEQKRKTRPQERRGRKFEKEAPHHKRPQAEAEPKRREEPRELPDDVLVGRNAVTEALKSGRGINKLWIASGDREGSVAEIAALAKERGIVVQYVERAKIEHSPAATAIRACSPTSRPFLMPSSRTSSRRPRRRERRRSSFCSTNSRTRTISAHSCAQRMRPACTVS